VRRAAGPFVFVAVFVAAFIVVYCAGLRAQQQVESPDTLKNPLAGDRDAAEAGKTLFDQTCSGCHGSDGVGGRGPALNTGEFTHGGEDADLFRTIQSGISGTQMPAFSALPTDSVWKIVSYLRSLSASAPVNEVVPGDPAAGQAIFWGKGGCSACHEVNGKGSVLGPDLSAIGRSSAAHLRAVIADPRNAQAGDFRSRRLRLSGVSVTTGSGEQVTGIRRAEDDFTLLMTDMSGTLRSFRRADLKDEHDLAQPMMPDTYSQMLTADEITNLIAYLKSLKARDLTAAAQAVLPPGLTFDRLRNAQKEPQNWLTYWGNYQGTHFSALKQINTLNVKQLQLRWTQQMPAGPLLEANPIVVDGVMYTTYTANGAQGVWALDAASGLAYWKYERRQKTTNPYETNPFNRGVAIIGSRLFFGTLDGDLVALDARSGRELWETKVADNREGYSITEAPLAIKNQVIVGVAGGEFGIRGFLDSYDAATGKRLWRFYTLPGPGQPGHDTWSGDSWKTGSGATWLTGSYDPELNLVYWTVGNPGPDLNPDMRKGDNLYTCSVIALDADSGKLKWYYQFTPNDTHDWDATEDLILTDAPVNGVMRKLMLHADRNGEFYVLDRTNGKFIFARPYVKETWNTGFKPDGTPIFTEKWKASPEGTLASPGYTGGADWQDPSYDAARSRLFVVASDGALVGYRSGPAAYEAGRQFMGGRNMGAAAGPGQDPHGALFSIDTRNGEVMWQYRTTISSDAAGDLATAGGVVFLCTAGGDLIALDSDTGKPVWHMQTGDAIASAPISFSVNGKQYISLSAGSVLYTFALPDSSQTRTAAA
jgi:alcohol dehydrogenase (cytochrome c)